MAATTQVRLLVRTFLSRLTTATICPEILLERFHWRSYGVKVGSMAFAMLHPAQAAGRRSLNLFGRASAGNPCQAFFFKNKLFSFQQSRSSVDLKTTLLSLGLVV